ncbi:nicotinate-nucleotide--dimethylbenzimidazole phosphoribosyltransferase [Streptomyces californicus]|uniref:nicotinate-nucleotide--dimethylbenzimidazole phosphoribosyltransferase n=1 Tax=Streptomyces californicus TaxID=67351 RepID=UPI0004C01043|nr:nicotinate-nucleotide--dimethylbenzimidazole phosphoribosyltransferase [Streptomyces californicus]QRV57937.1 nicotinate-nucleotide--dimethylbenzimidazole phosphoribosyltransferase [Streptomyces californicus]
MTDTGQIPGEGLPENAGMVEQPGVPAPDAYTYLDPSEHAPEDDDLLLMPASHGAWGEPQAAPAPAQAQPAAPTAVAQPAPQHQRQTPAQQARPAQAPAGPHTTHESGGRDSGHVDLNGVRVPAPAPAPVGTPAPARRPLHRGPAAPEAPTYGGTQGGVVRSLADRGPAGATRTAAPSRPAGPQAGGAERPEAPAEAPSALPGPQLGEIPPQAGAPWGAPQPEATPEAAPVPEQPVAEAGQAAAEPEQTAVEPGQTVAEPVAAEQTAAPSTAVEPSAEEAPQPEQAVEPSAEEAPQPEQAVEAGRPVAGPAPVEQPVVADPAAAPAEAPAAVEAEQPAGATEEDVTERPAQSAQAAAPEGTAEQPAAPAPAAQPEPAAVAEQPEPVGVAEQSEPAAVPEQPEPVAVAEQPVEPAADSLPEQPVEPGVDARPEPAAPAVQAAPDTGRQAVPAEPVPAETVVPEPVAGQTPPAGPADVPETPAAASAPADGSTAPEAEHPAVADAAASQPEPQAVPVDPAAVVAEGQSPAQEPAPEQPATEPAQAEPVRAEPEAEVRPDAPALPGQEQAVEAVAAPAETAEPAHEEPTPAPEQLQDAPVAGTPEAVTAPETAVAPEAAVATEDAVAESAAQPAAPVEPEPAAAPSAEGAQGEDASEPPAGQLPAPEPETAPVAAEPVRATAPGDEDGAGPEAGAPSELPEPLDATRQDRSPATPAPAEQQAETAADQQAQPVADDRQASPQEAAQPTEAERPEAAAELPDAAGQAAPEEAPASEEPAEPATPPAPGYDDAEREAVLRVMRERRDIRNGFRSDPIPHEVLLRVLEAAHTAPSVGHSQPWDFVVIRSAETRRSMHELAQRQRDAYAKSLPKGRAKQFKELKIEAILDTPVNIVVTADPTRGGRHTLGRHTQPQMAPYSSALAVENLWLAARAEGLGVGWVSFFDEREMVRALGLPEHLEVVAYLCVGYVDEFPEEPELMQAGWSKRRPLSWVVHEETYGRRALPGAEPHDLLQETISAIRPLDAKALGEAWERQKRMTKPAGALGMLEIISAQLSGLSRACPPPIPEPAAVAIFAGDHGVHAQGVTAWPQEVTAQMVANFLGGGAVCNAFAAQVGAEVCVVDVGVAAELPATAGLLPRKVRPGTADFTTGPALSREDVLAAIEVGIETARDLVAAGNKALLTGEMGIANTTASAALICVYTGIDASEVTGRGTGINDEMHARKVDVVRRALDLHQPDPADPIGVLAAVGGLEHAAMAGFLLGGASLRTPVILDGVSAGAAALVARAIAPEALAACIAGHRSAEPGHVAALNKLGLRPLVDLDLRLGEGTGALLALPIVQSAARAMHEVATFDSAGVTEK